VCDIVVKMFTFAISSPDEFLLLIWFQISRVVTAPNDSNNNSNVERKL